MELEPAAARQDPGSKTPDTVVIRHERGLPWQWLLAATLLVAVAMVIGLPALAEPNRPAPLPASVAAGPPPGGPPVAPPAAVSPGGLPAPGAAPAAVPPGEPPRVDPAEAKALLDAGRALVLDARDPTAYLDSHIPGAINVTPLEAAAVAGRLERGRPIVVYCD
jgi:hypothetical protein